MTADTTPESPLTTNPRPRVTTVGWLTGVTVIVLAWALVVALFGVITGRPWDVARGCSVLLMWSCSPRNPTTSIWSALYSQVAVGSLE